MRRRHPAVAAADNAEGAVAKAARTGLAHVRGRVVINDLAMLIATAQDKHRRGLPWATDLDRAVALLSRADLEAALAGAAKLVHDAVLRGGRVGADVLNEALDA